MMTSIKRNELNLQKKIELSSGQSQRQLAEKYNIGKTQVQGRAGIGGPKRESVQKGPLCTGRLRGFRGLRPHGPPCLLLQITPFKNLLYPKMLLGNRINLPIKN